MRLKKQERENYLRQIEELRNKKVLSAADTWALEYAWLKITADHFSRLSLNLQHIPDIFIIETLRKITGGPNTTEILRHYDRSWLTMLLDSVRTAGQRLQQLENVIRQELERRDKKTPARRRTP